MASGAEPRWLWIDELAAAIREAPAGTMQVRLRLDSGREVICDPEAPDDTGWVQRFVPREPIVAASGESFTITSDYQVNTGDQP